MLVKDDLRNNWLKFNNRWRNLESISQSMKKTRKMSTCNRWDLETVASRSIMPKNLSGQWFGLTTMEIIAYKRPFFSQKISWKPKR